MDSLFIEMLQTRIMKKKLVRHQNEIMELALSLFLYHRTSLREIDLRLFDLNLNTLGSLQHYSKNE